MCFYPPRWELDAGKTKDKSPATLIHALANN